MKTIARTLLYLQITLLIHGVGLPRSSAAAKELPFHGSIQGIEIADVQFPTIFVDGSGFGNATHLGRFHLTYELEVDLLTLPFETFGSSTFTAADGDTLSTDIVGRGTPLTNPNIVSVGEEHIITGGTGRFAHVTGGFVRIYFLNRLTGETSGSFDGAIVLH